MFDRAEAREGGRQKTIDPRANSVARFTGLPESLATKPGAPLAEPHFAPGFMLTPASQARRVCK
jgi:hypothetical protein